MPWPAANRTLYYHDMYVCTRTRGPCPPNPAKWSQQPGRGGVICATVGGRPRGKERPLAAGPGADIGDILVAADVNRTFLPGTARAAFPAPWYAALRNRSGSSSGLTVRSAYSHLLNVLCLFLRTSNPVQLGTETLHRHVTSQHLYRLWRWMRTHTPAPITADTTFRSPNRTKSDI